MKKLVYKAPKCKEVAISCKGGGICYGISNELDGYGGEKIDGADDF